jgi:iron(III) transport system ATP-binding protein
VSGGVAECALGRLPIRTTGVDGAATLMLRPEQLVATIVSDDDAPDVGVATVLASEFRGHDVLLTVDLGGDTEPVTVRQHSVAPPIVDAKVRIHVNGAAVVFGDDHPR